MHRSLRRTLSVQKGRTMSTGRRTKRFSDPPKKGELEEVLPQAILEPKRPVTFVRIRRAMLALAAASALAVGPVWPSPKCPLSYGTTDAAKSHTLFLYFPTADDPTFPAYDTGVSPARTFNVAGLDPTIGTTAALRDRIFDVVSDDYCEFNVQVLETTTDPATLPMPPPRRVTVAVGSDVASAWGEAQEVDIGDTINIDFARVW